jgi:hypothetical protein
MASANSSSILLKLLGIKVLMALCFMWFAANQINVILVAGANQIPLFLC